MLHDLIGAWPKPATGCPWWPMPKQPGDPAGSARGPWPARSIISTGRLRPIRSVAAIPWPATTRGTDRQCPPARGDGPQPDPEADPARTRSAGRRGRRPVQPLIGEQLAISPRTVEIHRANMLDKMGANHTSEAIRIAIEASLVD